MADIVTYRRIRNDNSESTILSFLAEHNRLPYSLTSYLVQTNAALVEAYWLLLFNKTLQVHSYLKHAQLEYVCQIPSTMKTRLILGFFFKILVCFFKIRIHQNVDYF